TGGTQPRITSYFSNSPLAMSSGPAEGQVAELLAPFSDELLPGTLEGYTLPSSDGRASNRRNIRKALQQLEAAGYTVEGGKLLRPDGTPFTFEILLPQGSSEVQAIVNIYLQALERLGIDATIATVDSAQYRERTDAYDFDLTWYTRGLSLSPGNEQYLYWGAEGVTEPGTRNLPGINQPAVEAMIDAMLAAEDREGFVSAVRALDRVLTAGRYVIPIWHAPIARIAHDARLKIPETLPLYGDWIGFQPDVWWYEDSSG
ncbi:MAG: ABC transporter substrate-binding protein, partial [Dinoroseobacter sp.]|nr:ABC transporter substrate-binding protein [Dinoroseobacter sp.]